MKKENYFFKVFEFCKKPMLFVSLALTTSLVAQDLNSGLKLHYTFDPATVNAATVSDVSGNGYNGTLVGATVGVTNGKNSLILSVSGTDYLDMGATTGNLVATLNDFSMSCYVWVNSSYASLGNNGNMIATFANSLDSYANSDGYMFLQAKRSRYAITTARYEAEQAVQTGVDVLKGKWVHLAYTQSGTTGKFFVDGVLKNTNANVTLTPSSLGATPYNMLAKPSYAGDKFLQDAQLSDFRIYNRAITSDEVLLLNNYPAELIQAYNSLTIGDLSALTSDINLPLTAGTAALAVKWKSSLPTAIDSTGKVVRPQQFDATVKLSATITKVVGETTYTLVKEFTAIVKAFNVAAEQLAQWNFDSSLIFEENGEFKVTDATASQYVATIKNDARIRTIGTTEKYNVLDLGNGTGYLDMGTEIGNAIYALNNYTMCGYFRIDEDYSDLGRDGNFYWTFSNTKDASSDKTGYIIGILKSQSHEITPGNYQANNQGVYGTAPAVGGWHHFAYTQNGTSGTVYVDGIQIQTGTITNLPALTLPQAGQVGTLYNWLGRSPYPGDVYLRKTLLYDFQLLSVPLTGDDLNFGFEVPATIDLLNNAYAENPDFIDASLSNEMDALTLTGLDAVTTNLTLPNKGSIDPSIIVVWKSSNDSLISASGVVKRPDYYSYKVTLTASLLKNGQKLTKTFDATVLPNEGTSFNNDLLVKFDFTNVVDSFVTDVAEKHFVGKLKNDARVITMGTSTKFKVLSLGDSVGYFDMGKEVGKVMYHQNDYTIGAFYRIDDSYTKIEAAGNFLWTISNTINPSGDPRGYIIGILKDQSYSISPKNWDAATGQQSVGFATAPLLGGWHYFGYTQSGTTGTIYIDGLPMAVAEITNTPATTLARPELLGSAYNWIGRSCYGGDIYLRKTLVHDFRIYSKALNDAEVQTSVLNVSATISALDAAYAEGLNALNDISTSGFSVITKNGKITIKGTSAMDKVSIYDIAGRKLNMTYSSDLSVNAGVYIVRINNYVTKVVVE